MGEVPGPVRPPLSYPPDAEIAAARSILVEAGLLDVR
jgi:hypothetical protein